jgi:hypothetical protein
MDALAIFLRLLAAIPLLTGAFDLVMGLAGRGLLGAELAPEGFRDPVLNSQIRFFGAMWLGYGVVLLLIASDVEKYSSLLRAMVAVTFLAALGRVASIVQFGLPSPGLVGARAFVIGTTAIEIVGMPLLWWWHAVLLKE